MPAVSQATLRKVKRLDRVARWIITLGGITVIGSVIVILLLIVGKTLPLFMPGRATLAARLPLPDSIPASDVKAIGLETGGGEHGQAAYVLTRDGAFTFLDLATAENLGRFQATAGGGAKAKTVQAVERHAGGGHTILWSDGSVTLAEVKALPRFDGGRKRTVYSVEIRAEFPGEASKPASLAIARAAENSATSVRRLRNNRLWVVRQTTTENLMGEKEPPREAILEDLALGPITALTMDTEGKTVYAGTETGQLAVWTLDENCSVVRKEIVTDSGSDRAVTALALLLGDVSLAVGDERGGLSAWFPVRSARRPSHTGPRVPAATGRGPRDPPFDP